MRLLDGMTFETEDQVNNLWRSSIAGFSLVKWRSVLQTTFFIVPAEPKNHLRLETIGKPNFGCLVHLLPVEKCRREEQLDIARRYHSTY